MKACFTCHQPIKGDYQVHDGTGAILCRPICFIVHEAAVQKALVEQISNNSFYVGKEE